MPTCTDSADVGSACVGAWFAAPVPCAAPVCVSVCVCAWFAAPALCAAPAEMATSICRNNRNDEYT